MGSVPSNFDGSTSSTPPFQVLLSETRVLLVTRAGILSLLAWEGLGQPRLLWSKSGRLNGPVARGGGRVPAQMRRCYFLLLTRREESADMGH